MAKYVFGIDLGTTYSCISYIDETGRPVIVQNKEGNNTTPSVVGFDDPTLVVVGETAKETAVMEPTTTVSLVKSLIGLTDYAITYNDKNLTPEEVSAYILRKVVEDAKEILNVDIKDVVITCPAYFGSERRQATKNAGIIAGLNVIEVISEPTAAALFYGCVKSTSQETVLVYDLGGGTFDVTVMEIGNGNIKVVCSDGDHDLGGKDWDKALMRHLAAKFEEAKGIALIPDDEDEAASVVQDLAIKAEKAKQQLTSKGSTKVQLMGAGQRATIEITREEFDDITTSLLVQTFDKTQAAVDIAVKEGLNVTKILLVGGSTKMPQVKAKLSEKYSNVSIEVLEPDEAVAKGAAIYALGAYEVKVSEYKAKLEAGELDLNDESVKEEIENYKEPASISTSVIPVLDGKAINEVVTAAATKSYALSTLVGEENKCVNLIFKNSTMREGFVSNTQTFYTVRENQEEVLLQVYENDFMDDMFNVDEELKLGECTLNMPPNLPNGAPLDVTFSLDHEGILDVTGLDTTGGRKINVQMKTSSGASMTKEQVQEAKVTACAMSVE